MTGPTGVSYRAEIQRPDGDGWTTVHTDPHAWGPTPEQAGWSVLQHHWPVSVYDLDPGKHARRREVLAQAGGYRMVLTPSRYSDGPTEPVTLTLAEIVLAEIRRQVANRQTAREQVAAARQALRDAQLRQRVAGHNLDTAKAEAARLQVPDADIKRAARPPRKPKTATKGTTP